MSAFLLRIAGRYIILVVLRMINIKMPLLCLNGIKNEENAKLARSKKMNEIVRVAEKEIGQIEKPLNSNKTKYGKWFGFDGVAWCGMFVSWVYATAGFQLPKKDLQVVKQQ